VGKVRGDAGISGEIYGAALVYSGGRNTKEKPPACQMCQNGTFNGKYIVKWPAVVCNVGMTRK